MTLEDYKKNKKRNMILTTIFGIVAAITFLMFYACQDSSDEAEETSNAIVAIGMTSFFLCIIFVVLVSYFGICLNKDDKRIEAIEKNGVSPEKVNEYLAEQQEKEEKNKQAIKKAKKEGGTYYYDGNGDVHINHPSTKNQTKKTSKPSWLDDEPEDHEIFDDPDIDDLVIMDFLDDDEDNFD